jgi:hypothetical protein
MKIIKNGTDKERMKQMEGKKYRENKEEKLHGRKVRKYRREKD